MTELSDKILALRASGKNYNEIKAELGCSKGTIAYYCGENQRSKATKRQRDRRRTISDYLKKLKQESLCADCGEDYPYWVMDFDHLENKEFSLSAYRRTGKTFEEVKKEIVKCEIVCSNCHRTRTHTRYKNSQTNSEFFDISEYYE